MQIYSSKLKFPECGIELKDKMTVGKVYCIWSDKE